MVRAVRSDVTIAVLRPVRADDEVGELERGRHYDATQRVRWRHVASDGRPEAAAQAHRHVSLNEMTILCADKMGHDQSQPSQILYIFK